MPRFIWDCDSCQFLGQDGPYDIYHHTNEQNPAHDGLYAVRTDYYCLEKDSPLVNWEPWREMISPTLFDDGFPQGL